MRLDMVRRIGARAGRVFEALQRRVGWPIWALSLVLFVGFLGLVLPAEAERTLEATGTEQTPDTSYVYTAGDLERLAGRYGEEGRAHYVRSRFTFDVVWPLVYGFFLQSSLVLASRRSVLGRLPVPLLLLPSAAVVFDLLENTAASIVMARYPDTTAIAVHAAPVFTFVKWNLVYGSFALVAIGAVDGLVRGVRAHHGTA
jgi:hypothetical protein